MKIIRPTCPRAGSEKLSYSYGRSPDSPPVLLAYLPIDSVDSGNQRMASNLMEEYSSGHCAGLAPDFPLVMGCAPQAESAPHHSSRQRYTIFPHSPINVKSLRFRRQRCTGVAHLSGTETIQLIVKGGERSTPTGVPLFRPGARGVAPGIRHCKRSRDPARVSHLSGSQAISATP